METALLRACIEWVNETDDRAMMFEHDSRYPGNNKLYLYSYKIGTGVVVNSIADIPSDEDLIVKGKMELKERLERLEENEEFGPIRL